MTHLTQLQLPLKVTIYERYGNSADAAMDIAKGAATADAQEQPLF